MGSIEIMTLVATRLCFGAEWRVCMCPCVIRKERESNTRYQGGRGIQIDIHTSLEAEPFAESGSTPNPDTFAQFGNMTTVWMHLATYIGNCHRERDSFFLF